MFKEKKKKIYGWARQDYSLSYYLECNNLEQIDDVFNSAIKKNYRISLRSAGRSYGDNTLNNNNIILKHSNFQRILDFDSKNGIITVQSGISMDKMINFSVPKGWIFNVCPAHRYVTISGALSNNVHGKNCFNKGYFGEYVIEFNFYSYKKGLIRCSRTENSKIFYAVISGLGILGLILEVKIQLRKINSFYLSNETNRFDNLGQILDFLETAKSEHEFNIASIDATKFSSTRMRGIVYSSDFANDGNLMISNYDPKTTIKIINYIYILTKNLPLSTSVANMLFSIKTGGKLLRKKFSHISYAQMNFLLDMILPKYNFFFKKGFVEYQAVFNSENAEEASISLREVLKKNNSSALLTAIKVYRKSKEPFIFSLKQDGYCMSFDIPFENNNKMDKIIRSLNSVTIKYEGQLYLAKTPCVNYEEFSSMYDNIQKFLEIKKDLDPENIIISDMSRRLRLHG